MDPSQKIIFLRCLRGKNIFRGLKTYRRNKFVPISRYANLYIAVMLPNFVWIKLFFKVHFSNIQSHFPIKRFTEHPIPICLYISSGIFLFFDIYEMIFFMENSSKQSGSFLFKDWLQNLPSPHVKKSPMPS